MYMKTLRRLAQLGLVDTIDFVIKQYYDSYKKLIEFMKVANLKISDITDVINDGDNLIFIFNQNINSYGDLLDATFLTLQQSNKILLEKDVSEDETK